MPNIPHSDILDAAFLVPNAAVLNDSNDALLSAIGNRTGTPEPKRCWNFDGSNDHIILEQFIDGSTSNAFACMAWFQFQDVSVNEPLWYGLNGANSSGRLLTNYDGTTKELKFTLRESASIEIMIDCDVSGLINSTSEWHHIAFTFDGTPNFAGMAIYLDASLLTPVTTSDNGFDEIDSDLGDMRFMRSTTAYAQAKVFDMRTFQNQTIDASAVLDAYNFRDIGEPLQFFRCDEGRGTTGFDSSGKGNHCTLVNITTSTFHYEGADVPYSYQNNLGMNNYSYTEYFGDSYGNRKHIGNFQNGVSSDASLISPTEVRYERIDTNLMRVAFGSIYGEKFYGTSEAKLIMRFEIKSDILSGTSGGRYYGLADGEKPAMVFDASSYQGSAATGGYSALNIPTMIPGTWHTVEVSTNIDPTLSYVSGHPYWWFEGAGYSASEGWNIRNISYDVLYKPLPVDASTKTKDIAGQELSDKGKIKQLAKIVNVNVGAFNGTSSYVSIPHNANQNINRSAFSICGWIYMTDATTFRILTKGNNVSDEIDYFISLSTSDTISFVITEEGSAYNTDRIGVQSGNALTTYEGEWIFVYAGYTQNANDNSDLTLRVFQKDGTEIDLGTKTSLDLGTFTQGAYSNNDIYIGGNYASDYANGNFHDLRIIAQELTTDEILSVINGSLIGTEVSIWTFNEGVGDKVYDLIGGNHGTWMGHTNPNQWAKSDVAIDYRLLYGFNEQDIDLTGNSAIHGDQTGVSFYVASDKGGLKCTGLTSSFTRQVFNVDVSVGQYVSFSINIDRYVSGECSFGILERADTTTTTTTSLVKLGSFTSSGIHSLDVYIPYGSKILAVLSPYVEASTGADLDFYTVDVNARGILPADVSAAINDINGSVLTYKGIEKEGLHSSLDTQINFQYYNAFNENSSIDYVSGADTNYYITQRSQNNRSSHIIVANQDYSRIARWQGGITPYELNTILWLDARDINNLTLSNNVPTSINDKSSRGASWTITNGVNYNGKSISLDGTTYLNSTDTINDTGVGEVFVVFKANNVDNIHLLLTTGDIDVADGNQFRFHLTATAAVPRVQRSVGTNSYTGDSNSNELAKNLYHCKVNSSSSYEFGINDASVVGTGSGTTNFLNQVNDDRIRIGRDSSSAPTTSIDGELYEIVIIKGSLTNNERDRLKQYFYNKHNIVF